MPYMPSGKEIEAMSKQGSKERYRYALKRIADFEEVWLLGQGSQFAMSADDGGSTFLPIWPAQAYAQMCATQEWAECRVKSMALGEFMRRLLPQLRKGQIGIGIFMLPSTDTTPVVMAANLLRDLEQACAEYGDAED